MNVVIKNGYQLSTLKEQANSQLLKRAASKTHLDDTMAEAAVTEGTPVRLSVPAKLTSGRATREIESAITTNISKIVIRCTQRIRAATLLVCMLQSQPLRVPTISNCDVHWPTRVVCVIEYPINPLVRMHLPKYDQIADFSTKMVVV